jgi:hypothetical protein
MPASQPDRPREPGAHLDERKVTARQSIERRHDRLDVLLDRLTREEGDHGRL